MSEFRDNITKRIIQVIELDKQGNVRMNGVQIFEYNRAVTVFLSELTETEWIRKLGELKYKINFEDNWLIGDELKPIFGEMKKEEKTKFSEFEQKFELWIQKLKETKLMTFELFYPINLKYSEKFEKIIFRELEVEILDYDEVKDKIDRVDVKKSMQLEEFDSLNYSYLKITISGRNVTYAKQVATEYAQLLFGLITFIQTNQTETMTIIGVPKEIIQLKPNYIFVFSENKYWWYFFPDKSNKKPTYKLNSDQKKKILEILAKFNKVEKEVEEILLKTLKNYYQGTTEKIVDYSFLSFWTALEAVTITEKQDRNSEVIKRLKSIIITKSLDDKILNEIYKLRNEFVHTGESNITQYKRNLLKNYLEKAIMFFIEHLSQYKKNEIKIIFQLLQDDEKTLAKTEELIGPVRKIKQKIN